MFSSDRRRNRTRGRTSKWLRVVEVSAWSAGLALLGFWVLARSHGALARASDVKSFELARAEIAEPQLPPEQHAAETRKLESTFDFSLWAEGRIKKYRDSLAHELGLPAGVLRIPELDLTVPIHEGTSELVLNRAVGHIAGTAAVDEAGNIGIAGHRDGVFRGLKDIKVGDVIELDSLEATRTYVIDRITIVEPQDVWVLDPTPEPAITLVTCYPFYFVGKAPKRYIVRATLESSTPTAGVVPVADRSGVEDKGQN